ncbi:hypothetical protein MJ572_04080 [Escherichia coli]|nr:hypothetical protein MJ572_04080 [Escherichia coli]
MMINITHQHGIDFGPFKTGLKCGIDPCHDLGLNLSRPYGMKLVSVAINADVDASKSSIAPVRHIAFQTVTR